MKKHIKISESLQDFLQIKKKGVVFAAFEFEKIQKLIKLAQKLEEQKEEEALFKNMREDSDVLLPSEVVRLNVIDGYSLIAAWRMHLGLSQKTLANLVGVAQSTIAKFEKSDCVKLTTLKRLADAMGIEYDQLVE